MYTIRSKCANCGKQVTRRRQSKPVKRHFCCIECKAEFQRRSKPVTKEWLYNEYIVKGRHCGQIAKTVKRDAKTVWNWLKAFGIPTRPRGSYDQWRPRGRKSGYKHSKKTKQKIRDASIADGRVPYLKNGTHWLSSVPKSKHPKWEGGITADRQKLYSSKEWIAVSKAVYKRDRSTCRRCHRKWSKGLAFDIHHIVPFVCKDLRATLSNLVLLCEQCHYWVHSSKNTKRRFIKPCP